MTDFSGDGPGANEAAAPDPFTPDGAKLIGTKFLASLQTGWRSAAIPAAQLYGGLILLAFLVTAAAAVLTGARFGDFSFPVVVRSAGLAVAMAFRGAFRFETSAGLGDIGFQVVAAPLGLTAVALAGAWFLARRAGRRSPGTEAWPLGLRFALAFAGLTGAGAVLARTSEGVFGDSGLTLRATVVRALLGTFVFCFPVATLAVLSAQGRLGALRQQAAAKLGGWARPLTVSAAVAGVQVVAAGVIMAAYGLYELSRADMGTRSVLGVALVGLLYLPNLAIWALGVAGGASFGTTGSSLFGPADRAGWFASDRPPAGWLLGSALAIAIAVAGALWLGRRAGTTSRAWVWQYAVGMSGLWVTGAVLARATYGVTGAGPSASLGVVLSQCAVAGLAMGLLAGAAACFLLARGATSPAPVGPSGD